MRSRRQSIGGLGNLMFKQARLIAELLDGHIPDIYVQGTQYWNGHEAPIRQYFREGMGKPIKKVGLHIRRGDYLKADNFHLDLWKTDYYQQAVRMFDDQEFIVFCRDRQSDAQDIADREWCEQNIPLLLEGKAWEFAPLENTETDDLNLMASCESLIMANSSFSWWAAFLGDHRRVVCPKQWFVDGKQRTELLPKWILL